VSSPFGDEARKRMPSTRFQWTSATSGVRVDAVDMKLEFVMVPVAGPDRARDLSTTLEPRLGAGAAGHGCRI